MILLLAAFITVSSGARLQAAKPELTLPAGATGKAKLDCVVTEAGGLSNCTVLLEEPSDHGVGGAALDYASTLKVKLGEGPDGFKPGAHFVRTLKVEATPPAEQEVYADIRCNVAGDGKLDGCRVLKESQTGMGVGENALKIIALTQVKADGTAGQTFQTRIRFKLNDQAPSR